jgi:hypothetical protein
VFESQTYFKSPTYDNNHVQEGREEMKLMIDIISLQMRMSSTGCDFHSTLCLAQKKRESMFQTKFFCNWDEKHLAKHNQHIFELPLLHGDTSCFCQADSNFTEQNQPDKSLSTLLRQKRSAKRNEIRESRSKKRNTNA